MKQLILITIISFLQIQIQAESFVYLQNNTQYSLGVTTTSTLSSSYWNNTFNGSFGPWKLQTKLYETNRDQGISNGSNFYFTTTVSLLGESFTLQLKLNGNFIGSDMWQSSAGPTFDDPWYGDRNFHTNTFTIAGKTFELKYRADLPPGNISDDIYYVIQEVNPYPQNASELSDGHIFNVLSYNVFMLTPPIGSSDEYDRAKIIDDYVHGYDAIIISEAFYNSARNNELLPRLATEYPYQTAVVDDGNPIHEDGGVLIVSRWPFDNEDQINFSDCNGTDCLAAKGAMYVRINKLGVKYHLIGTHTQAWPEADDRATRQLQFAQMRNWINGKSIPTDEAILIGGDLNVDKLGNLGNEYGIMHQLLHTKSPNYLGDNFTYNPSINTFGSGPVEYLDYVLVDTNHFSPAIYTNQPQILRHVESVDDLWDNNDLELDLSDHFAVHGRFVYPKITQQPVGQSICTGANLVLTVGTNISLNYQWQKDDININGANAATYSINNASSSDAGTYQCIISHDNGQITSNSAIVSVLPITSISQQLSDLTVCEGAPITWSVNASGDNLSYQWYFDNVAIPNATTASYTINSLELNQEGNYAVNVYGTCDTATSNSELTVGSIDSTVLNDSIICPGSTIDFYGISHQGNGTLTHVLQNSSNCDSVIQQTFIEESIEDSIIQNGSQLEATSGYNHYQWYLGGVAISGANSPTYVFSEDGTYTCEISSENCTILSNSIDITSTGILSNLNGKLHLFPNPTNHFLHLDLLGNDVIVDMKLFDINGHLLKSIDPSTREIEVDDLPRGLYLLQINTENDNISMKFQKL